MRTATAPSPSSGTKHLRVLLVEDDAEDALLFRRVLGKLPHGGAHVEHATTLAEGTAALATTTPFDVVLLDLGLPDGRGLDMLASFLNTGCAVVVLTGCNDLELAAEAVRRGAQDYLPKHCLDAPSLHRSIQHAIERHRLHQELVTAHEREQQLKDEVLSHVSHELRTPLTAVAAFVDLLREGHDGAINARQQEYLKVIERNVRQLKRLIGDLMDVSRISTGKLTLDVGLVDVAACIADVAEAGASAAAEKGIELEIDHGSDLPRVLGDAARVTQVLQNLVDNAVKFTPKGGRIAVRSRLGTGSTLQVEVEDTGCGIQPEMRERLFERLQQDDTSSEGSRRGLGLGLWITRELALSMNGAIDVRSEVGSGSTFTVTLPVYSIEQVVQHVFDEATRQPVSLVEVTLSTGDDQEAGCRPDTARREAMRALQRCLVASTDMVVPEAFGSGATFHLFALVRADAKGAEVVCSRVETEFRERAVRLTRCGYRTAVKATTFAPPPAPEGDAAWMATVVREHVERRRG